MHHTYVALHEVTWCMVEWCTQNLRRDGSSFTWHQPCQRCNYTTSVDIQKTRYKKTKQKQTKTSHSCERSESARKRRIALYKSDEQQQQRKECHFQTTWRHVDRKRVISSRDFRSRVASRDDHGQSALLGSSNGRNVFLKVFSCF